MTLADKMRDLGIGYGWNHPYFMPGLSKIKIHETSDKDVTRTMAVDIKGNVYMNTEWVKGKPEAHLAGVLFHELMHLMMAHAHRQEGRTKVVQTSNGYTVPLFNIAADMAINHMLKEMGIGLPDGACYPPYGMEQLNTEQLYEYLDQNLEEADSGGSGRSGQRLKPGLAEDVGDGEAAAGCGVKPDPDGDGGQGDGEPQDGGGGQSQGDAQDQTDHAHEWEKIASQARSIAAGVGKGHLFAKLFERRKAVRWEQLCRSTVSRALAQHGRDEQSWSRRNRRSPGRIILPGWKATKAVGACIIDASGSVSDEMLSTAVDQIQRVAEIACSRIWLIVHDYGVQTSGWIDGRSRQAIQGRVVGRGGTDFHQAYAAMAAVPARFDFMIHLTDGEIGGTWPERPKNCRRMVVALLGNRRALAEPPAGSVVVNVDLELKK